MKKLSEKFSWALITGASSGIGREFAFKLAENRINLILVSRNENKLNEIKDNLLSKYSIEIIVLSVDLTSLNSINKLIEFTENIEIDLLINNAGFGYSGEFIDDNVENIDSMIELNCKVPAKIAFHYGRLMANRNNGAIIFLGSVLAFYPTPFSAVYSATKAFNLYLGEALAREFKSKNVKVLALNPGSTNTEFHNVAGMKKGPYLRTPAQVVNTALKSLGKKETVVDGYLNKFMVFLVRFMPRKLNNIIVGSVIKKLNKSK